MVIIIQNETTKTLPLKTLPRLGQRVIRKGVGALPVVEK